MPARRSAPRCGSIIASGAAGDRQHAGSWTTRIYGPGYADDEIEQFLQWAKVPYRRLDDIANETADILASDR